MRVQLRTFAWGLWAALVLLAVMFVQLLGAATQLSATIDEGFHITSGYEYLRTGRLRLFDEHVPLAKALFAWPLFFVPDLPPPEGATGWDEGNLIQVAQETVLAYQPIDRVIVASRIPVTLLTLLLAAAVYRWTAKWFGSTAGVLALVLFSFDPNILAHGSLATTDMGAVAFIFWAVWAFSCYLNSPQGAKEGPARARRWWVAAAFLGLAQAAKLTALLLLPLFGVLALADAWVKADRDWMWTVLRRLLSYAGMVIVAALVVWAFYLFEVRPVSDVGGDEISLPAASHIERLLRLQDNIAYGRESFLMGQNSMHGWWQYFPIAFVLKTPLPTMLFAVLALGALLFGRRRRLTDELALGLFPLVYAGASLISTLNIGYRHLLPILPFLFVSAGRVVGGRMPVGGRQWPTLRGRWRGVLRYSLLALLVIWVCVETLLIHPHFLAYFNPIAGGADQGYRFLADSNTDWGQALKALGEYQRRTDGQPVKLSQFTFLDPASYGVRYEPIAPMRDAPPVLPRRFNPQPGKYAISATTLDGVPLPLPSTYDWFRHREPQTTIAHVMFLYDVSVQDEPGQWVAQCTIPVVPLPAEIVMEGFGVAGIRRVYFDCEQSWLFPEGGASPGWYARATPGIDGLHWPRGGERLERWPAWVERLPLSALRLNYVQPTSGGLPAFTIWEWSGVSLAPPRTVGEQETVFGGTLAFWGYAAPLTAQPGTSVDVVTYWRVVAQPVRPLSLMLHLTRQDGVPIAVGDGLGVPIDQWTPGDVLVQRHSLAIPSDTSADSYIVRSGVYWLDDLARLMAADNDSITLTSIKVTR